MPTTRKQRKARKSRGLEMLSDIENLDNKVGKDHFSTKDREANLNSNSVRRPGITTSHYYGKGHENTHVNSKVINPGNLGRIRSKFSQC